jgi:CspA family cold shock protein
MSTGNVKWFNDAKGYGFIGQDDGGEDLFVHFSSLPGDGYKSLREGQPVQYDVQQGRKGLEAINIVPT